MRTCEMYAFMRGARIARAAKRLDTMNMGRLSDCLPLSPSEVEAAADLGPTAWSEWVYRGADSEIATWG